MPRIATEHPEKSREPNLLQEFAEARLRRDHLLKLRSTIARLGELYEEYHGKDTILASAILFVKLHIESHYLVGQDANLVHNLTALHIYPRVPLDCAPDESAAV